MKKNLVTVADIRRANDRLMGKIQQKSLSPDDYFLYLQIKRTLPSMKDSLEP